MKNKVKTESEKKGDQHLIYHSNLLSRNNRGPNEREELEKEWNAMDE